MRVCAIICEYNPFHNGHALHIARARTLSQADYVVCIMSGSVTQRGTFARHDKWLRADMALQNGCDLVLELPTRFSCAPAPEFASGGVALLSALGVSTHLAFGCEPESLPLLFHAVEALREESPAFQQALRAGLDSGLPYPRARAQAAQQASGLDDLEAIMSRPNAALAIEYLRALPPAITPVPISREGNAYHDSTLSLLASATAIRQALTLGNMEGALSATPCSTLLRHAEEQHLVHAEEALTQALLYRLRTLSPLALSQIAGMDEGLEYRFLSAARTACSRDALIQSVKSKRYTYARLSRLCSYILLDITREFTQSHTNPTYARVLGFRREAQPLLRAIKAHSSIPLITKAADADPNDPLFALDVRAQDLWSLGCSCSAHQHAGRDFTSGIVIR